MRPIKDGEIATITNNVLMKFGARKPLEHAVFDAKTSMPSLQCEVLGIFGRNNASSPIAGRNAQTW